jgi:hypothetical protein
MSLLVSNLLLRWKEQKAWITVRWYGPDQIVALAQEQWGTKKK